MGRRRTCTSRRRPHRGASNDSIAFQIANALCAAPTSFVVWWWYWLSPEVWLGWSLRLHSANGQTMAAVVQFHRPRRRCTTEAVVTFQTQDRPARVASLLPRQAVFCHTVPPVRWKQLVLHSTRHLTWTIRVLPHSKAKRIQKHRALRAKVVNIRCRHQQHRLLLQRVRLLPAPRGRTTTRSYLIRIQETNRL